MSDQKSDSKQGPEPVTRLKVDVANLKYLGTTITDQYFWHEGIKNRLNSENAYYHSVQSLLSSCLLSRNVTVKI
jgi:hypothetical protein